MARDFEAVEVGANEWFLGRPDSDAPDHGYDPFIDLEASPGRERELAEEIADAVNKAVREAVSAEREWFAQYVEGAARADNPARFEPGEPLGRVAEVVQRHIREAEAAMKDRCILAIQAQANEDPTNRDYVAGLSAAEDAIRALE